MTPTRAHKDTDKARGGVERIERNDRRHLTPTQYERLLKIIALLIPEYSCHGARLASTLEISV